MASTFTIFNNLPYDVRYLIWSKAVNPVNDWRIIRLKLYIVHTPGGEPEGRPFFTSTEYGIPLIPLSVIYLCREARAIAMARFPDTATIYRPFPTLRWPGGRILKFNAAKDFFQLQVCTLSSDRWAGLSLFRNYLNASLISRIQNLALYHTEHHRIKDIGRILPFFSALNRISGVFGSENLMFEGVGALPKAQSAMKHIVGSSWEARREARRETYRQGNPHLIQRGDEVLSRLTYSLSRLNTSTYQEKQCFWLVARFQKNPKLTSNDTFDESRHAFLNLPTLSLPGHLYEFGKPGSRMAVARSVVLR